MRPVLASALLLLLVLLPGVSAWAAIPIFASRQGPIPVDQTFNPHPDPQDIILPMPCDLSMVLRAVAVPGAPGQDSRIPMGLETPDRGRRIYEQRAWAHLAGTFVAEDLPLEWQQKVASGLPQATFYFVGKYEVSQYQWDAVMKGQCAERSLGSDALPKREISWFELQTFFHRYNAWLISRRPDSLPRFAGNERNIGVLRLPTEEEWEFAARGGIQVSAAEREKDIFPLGEHSLQDYGVFSSAGGMPVHEPEPIGSRRPNPLGLYDTVGNVKEIVDGFFRLSVAGRRGGAAGGSLCKGGSFRSKSEEEVFPGWREEAPRYTANGEHRPSDMGFRVALSGITVPSAQRLHALTQIQAGDEFDRRTGLPSLPQALTIFALAFVAGAAGAALGWSLLRNRRSAEANSAEPAPPPDPPIRPQTPQQAAAASKPGPRPKPQPQPQSRTAPQAAPKPKASTLDATCINNLGMRFALIPAGAFLMGTAANVGRPDEQPQHTVRISQPFYIGIHPVIQAQWQAVMGKNPSYFKGPGNPVENVSWEEVQRFSSRLNERERTWRYRLPTEAEWEYAARAGSQSLWSFGDTGSSMRRYGWFRDNAGGSTHPVGQKQANAWGLFDVHGNVYEWVQDWYAQDYYSRSPVRDPQGPENGTTRVFRGGSWIDGEEKARSGRRFSFAPDFHDNFIGFRLVLAVEKSPGQAA